MFKKVLDIKATKSLAVLVGVVILVIIVFLSGVFSPQKNMIVTVPSQNSALPYTVDTYGNAWDGIIVFGANNYLVVMSTNGTLLEYRTVSSGGYGIAKNIAQDTLLFQGEPQIAGANSAPNYATHIWNLATNQTQDFPNVIGEHDVMYDPTNNTFLTLQEYVREVGNNSYLIDKIVQLDPQGNVLWTWDTHNYIPLSEADPFNNTSTINGHTVIDFTHTNALDWDYNNSIIYLNVRNTNTFYKINQTTGNVIWACGQFGNFTLVDNNGNVVPSLWYHGHDLAQIAPDVFTMFNNDLDNTTYYNDSSSQLIEFTLNENNMTANEIWSWTAPQQYYSTYLGAAYQLPNGDWIGDFGSPTHQFTENQPWNFNNTGAVLIEVNPSGQIVRTITFPTGWSIYRMGLVTNISQNLFSPTPAPTPSPSPPSTPFTTITTPIPTPSPTLAQTLTPTSTPKPTLTPTPTQSETPTIKPTSNSSFNSMNIVDSSILVIVVVIVIVAVILAYIRRKTNPRK